MNLRDIISRQAPPVPWAEGDKIPWNEPQFSERMLREHLSQWHDAASRRLCTVDQQVAWIHNQVLSEKPSRILDLGCGPGLYLQRLAKLGHECAGIDFSPASIAYARKEADIANLVILYEQEDIRCAEYSEGFDLVMLIFGEFNVFRADDAQQILRKANNAMSKDGIMLLEVQSMDSVRARGTSQTSWRSLSIGLFSDKPHLWLQENFWDEPSKTSTTRHFIIDAATAGVSMHTETAQAYPEEQYRLALEKAGFGDFRQYPSLTGQDDGNQKDMTVWAARKL